LARRAAKIICVSEKTRRDLLSSTPSGRQNRVYLQRQSAGRPPEKAAAAAARKISAFCSERSGRKNFRFFAGAAAPVLKAHEDVRLLCTGSFSRWETDYLEALGIAGRCVGIDADDGELISLYQHALGLVYPTLYEGFGLPVLEAMVYGCPVLTAASGSVREVGGDAVAYINPYDAASIALGVEGS
jgi:glycosyltransferase involved in cell wall biosynthesis